MRGVLFAQKWASASTAVIAAIGDNTQVRPGAVINCHISGYSHGFIRGRAIRLCRVLTRMRRAKRFTAQFWPEI